MSHSQTPSTQQTTQNIPSIDPTSILQSESPTAVILVIAILISILISGLTGLVKVIMARR